MICQLICSQIPTGGIANSSITNTNNDTSCYNQVISKEHIMIAGS